jgi:hypothetical protein
MSSEDRPERPSLFTHKFTIATTVQADPVRWNLEWDKALHSLSAKDVYEVLSQLFSSDRFPPAENVGLGDAMRVHGLKAQNLLAKVWTDMEADQHFVTAWMLLEERDRQIHLLNGLREACKQGPLGVNARAMCPDIKISSMLKRKGKAFVEFLSSFTKEKNALGESALYQIPNQWWETAVDLSDSPLEEVSSTSHEVSSPSQEVSSPQQVSSSQKVNSPFELLTLQRNGFISESADTFCPYLIQHFSMQRISSLGPRCQL